MRVQDHLFGKVCRGVARGGDAPLAANRDRDALTEPRRVDREQKRVDRTYVGAGPAVDSRADANQTRPHRVVVAVRVAPVARVV